MPTARALPPVPDFADPVIVRDPKVGEPMLSVAARERAGRVAANGRIVGLRDWYKNVRRDYAQ